MTTRNLPKATAPRPAIFHTSGLEIGDLIEVHSAAWDRPIWWLVTKLDVEGDARVIYLYETAGHYIDNIRQDTLSLCNVYRNGTCIFEGLESKLTR